MLQQRPMFLLLLLMLPCDHDVADYFVYLLLDCLFCQLFPVSCFGPEIHNSRERGPIVYGTCLLCWQGAVCASNYHPLAWGRLEFGCFP